MDFLTSRRPVCGKYVVLLISGIAFSCGSPDESFHEELLLKSLNNGDVLAEFNFLTLGLQSKGQQSQSGQRSTNDWSLRHFDLMPKFVGELLVDHQLDELRVALTRGVWRWEHPLNPAPTGALVAARFRPDVGLGVDRHWRHLTNALAGQFCASLNFLDSAKTSQPKWSLNPNGVTSSGRNSSHFRYGTLPDENVCTENLTPWKKLLPCADKRGLAGLLNARSIHRTSYHSIGLSMRKVCRNSGDSCSNPNVELRLYVSLVFNPSSFPENLDKYRKIVKLNSNNWSLRSLFGIGINSKCPLATDSTLFIAQNEGQASLVTADHESDKVINYKGDKVYVYQVQDMIGGGFSNINVRYHEDFVLNRKEIPDQVLVVSRYQTGYGQEKGGIVTQIRNSGADPITVVVYDVIPWFLRIYFHTLKITSNLSHNRIRELQPIKSVFSPGLDRQKPYTMELVLTLPPKSSTKVYVGFEHSILKWNEYPPDANKGFYVGSALLSAVLPTNQTYGLVWNPKHSTFAQQFDNLADEALVQIYSQSLLVSLPTPDFSMPYNAICLACTVVALAFGPLLNLTTKALQITSIKENSAKSGFLSKIPIIKNFVHCQPTLVEEEEESKKDR